MKAELSRILWVWGPVTQYQIGLDGIDSSGHGACDVMEIITREDASLVTKEFILDDFMEGFIFTLYQQKWRKFGWYVHIFCRLPDAALVVLIAILTTELKTEVGEKKLYKLALSMRPGARTRQEPFRLRRRLGLLGARVPIDPQTARSVSSAHRTLDPHRGQSSSSSSLSLLPSRSSSACSTRTITRVACRGPS